MANYSQFIAYKALVKGSLRSIIKSPSSVIFTIAFPLIFIVALGWLDKNDGYKKPVIATQINDLHIIKKLSSSNYWTITPIDGEKRLEDLMADNNFDYILTQEDDKIKISSYSDQEQDHLIADAIRQNLQSSLEDQVEFKKINSPQGAISKKIDFILPGQLGFSLLAASVFGTAFVFFSLRNTYVLKRFFATPIQSLSILLAEGTSRLMFQMFGALLLITLGYFIFDLSLPSGIMSVIMMLLTSMVGVISFMSFGFIISGLARSESTVPPLANIIVLPQFILSDTFIPVQDLPQFAQYVAQLLPLTHFNQAVRLFAQHNITDVPWSIYGMHMLIVSIWGVVGYFLATKTFKWE